MTDPFAQFRPVQEEESGWKMTRFNQPVCDACRDEAAEYARYGIWGPP